MALLYQGPPDAQVGAVASVPDQAVVGGKQVVPVAGHLHPRVDQYDQVVADPFQVGDKVRGHHDAHALLGGQLHQPLQEVAPGERVECRHRLVEQQ